MQQTDKFISYRLDVYKFCLSLCKLEAEADDLTQEVMYRACKYAAKYDKNIKSWLFTIARNEFINSYRRKQAAKRLTINLQPTTVYNNAESDMACELIMQKLNELDDIYKQPLLLHLAGKDYDEITNELAIPKGTMQSRLFRGRGLLAKALNIDAKYGEKL